MNTKVQTKARPTKSQIIDSLISAIEQKKGDIPNQRKAAEELGRIGSKKAINYLISCLAPMSVAVHIKHVLRNAGEKLVPRYMAYLDAHVTFPDNEGAS